MVAKTMMGENHIGPGFIFIYLGARYSFNVMKMGGSKKNLRDYLGICPKMGGGHPNSQNFCKITKLFLACYIHSEVLKQAFSTTLKKMPMALYIVMVSVDDLNNAPWIEGMYFLAATIYAATILLYWVLKNR